MNLDRLLKLLKLANHNPNDAEANSAARRACKLLGEENYKWLESVKRHPSTLVDGNRGTWSGFDRSTEPQWRSTRPPPSNYPPPPPPRYNSYYGYGDPFGGFAWEDFGRTGERSGDKGYKKVYKEQCRDCTICKITRMTTDEETPYVCYECKRKG